MPEIDQQKGIPNTGPVDGIPSGSRRYTTKPSCPLCKNYSSVNVFHVYYRTIVDGKRAWVTIDNTFYCDDCGRVFEIADPDSTKKRNAGIKVTHYAGGISVISGEEKQ